MQYARHYFNRGSGQIDRIVHGKTSAIGEFDGYIILRRNSGATPANVASRLNAVEGLKAADKTEEKPIAKDLDSIENFSTDTAEENPDNTTDNNREEADEKVFYKGSLEAVQQALQQTELTIQPMDLTQENWTDITPVEVNNGGGVVDCLEWPDNDTVHIYLKPGSDSSLDDVIKILEQENFNPSVIAGKQGKPVIEVTSSLDVIKQSLTKNNLVTPAQQWAQHAPELREENSLILGEPGDMLAEDDEDKTEEETKKG